MSTPTSDGWEAVHMIYDFYDLPLSGVADFHGKPHAYQAIFDKEADRYSEVYELSPVDEKRVAFVRRYWKSWCSSPNDPNVTALLEAAAKVDTATAVRAIPTFRANLTGESLVRWSDAQ
jgi:hypothetical protein